MRTDTDRRRERIAKALARLDFWEECKRKAAEQLIARFPRVWPQMTLQQRRAAIKREADKLFYAVYQRQAR